MSEIRTDRFREFVGRLRERVEQRVEALVGLRAFSWLALLALAAAVAALITMSFQQLPSSMQVGMIAQRDIKADRNYEIVDEEASSKMREDATASVLPVFDLDTGAADALIARLNAAFEAARAALRERDAQPKGAAAANDAVAPAFFAALGVAVEPAQLSPLVADGFSARTQAALAELIRSALTRPVIAEHVAAEFRGNGALLRSVRRGEGAGASEFQEQTLQDVGALMTLEGAREALPRFAALRALRDEGLMRAGDAVVSALLEPNCAPNRIETTRRQESAAAGVKSVILKLNAGEMIIREGERFEPSQIKLIQGILMEKRHGAFHLEFAGTFLLALLLIALPFLLIERFFRRIKVQRADHALMAAIGIAVLTMLRFGLSLAPAVQEQLFFTVDVAALAYAIPVAGGAMLLRMFLGAELSLVFAAVLGIFAGMLAQNEVSYVAYCIVTGSVAVMAIANVDRRSRIISAGVFTGLAGAAAVLGILLVSAATVAVPFSFAEVIWSMVLAFLGGIGCAIFTMIAAPIIESISGYTSDIKLLELANLNHPLLRELIVRAPGTYHHSHVVGLLGEAAATAIGANALLVRVGAYYHDIGKLRKPLYFIENVKSGENRHERLTPHMSALIVSAHVKDGVELAEGAKIPRIIADMIPQHHGTRRISFFYDKAKSIEDPEVMKVDPKDFEYPGPKPQTREAAILMLADVAEAAVRALKEKGPARIEQTVQRVIHDIFNESQLDECDLTLRDLNAISEAFIRTLLAIYHLRIEYIKDMEYERPEGPHADEPTVRADPTPKRASSDSSGA